MAHGGATSKADFVLALSLASGATQDEAAAAAGVSRWTVARRLLDPDFRRQVSEARLALFERGVGLLSAKIVDAVIVLGNLLEAESEMARLGSARTILEHVVKMREHAEVNVRLAEVEKRVAALGGST